MIVLGRLFMRGSRGVGTGVRTNPSRMKKHKAVDFLSNTGLEKLGPISEHKATDVGSSSER